MCFLKNAQSAPKSSFTNHKFYHATSPKKFHVSEDSGTPKSSILIELVQYKLSILGYHYFWKHRSFVSTACPIFSPSILMFRPRFFRRLQTGVFWNFLWRCFLSPSFEPKCSAGRRSSWQRSRRGFGKPTRTQGVFCWEKITSSLEGFWVGEENEWKWCKFHAFRCL